MKTSSYVYAILVAVFCLIVGLFIGHSTAPHVHSSNENLYKEQRDTYLYQLTDAQDRLSDAIRENKALKEVNEHLSLEMRDLEKHVPTCKLPSFITTPCKITDELLQQHRPLTLRY